MTNGFELRCPNFLLRLPGTSRHLKVPISCRSRLYPICGEILQEGNWFSFFGDTRVKSLAFALFV